MNRCIICAKPGPDHLPLDIPFAHPECAEAACSQGSEQQKLKDMKQWLLDFMQNPNVPEDLKLKLIARIREVIAFLENGTGRAHDPLA